MTSTIKVDNIQKVSDGSNIIKKCGSTITIGSCGQTVAIASGATTSGMGRTGTVDWQTTPKTGTFTAVNGEGYFVNTSGGVSVANLPAGSAGAIVSFSDYTRTFATNKLTINPNGSEKIGGVAEDLILNVNGQATTLLYVDGTEGWINIQNAEDTQTGAPPILTATGGTITNTPTCRIHTFTSPGNFVVSALSGTPANNAVAYTVIAGGGAGGFDAGGGGGGGGYREGRTAPITPYTASPLVAPAGVTVSAQTYPIVIGAGGSGGTSPQSGSVSSGLGISSAGGGAGARHPSGSPACAGAPGGSGGGSRGSGGSGGSGNTPPVSPPQGTNGAQADGTPGTGGAGGGGASATGTGAGVGGAGVTSEITASPVAYSGGGGGSGNGGGTGGGGGPNTNGTANTGGGGGGKAEPTGDAPNGGSGIVIIRYKI